MSFGRLLPLSTLISASALTVIAYTSQKTRFQTVPTIDFNRNVSFQNGTFCQVAPVMERLAASSAATEKPLPISISIPNSIYDIEFLGPSLQCSVPSDMNNLIFDGYVNVGKMLDTVYNETLQRFQHPSGTRSVESGFAGAVIYLAASPTIIGLVRLGDLAGGKQSLEVKSFTENCVVGTGSCIIMQDAVYKDALWIRHQQDIACVLRKTKYHVRFQSTDSIPNLSLNHYFPLGVIDDPLPSYRSITQSLVNLLTGAVGFSTAKYCDTETVFLSDCQNEAHFVSLGTKIWSTILVGALNLSENTVPSKVYGSEPPPLLSVEDKAMVKNLTLGALIEEFSRKLTLDLFSHPYFLYVGS